MKNIPNILSLFRILLIPFFIWQMVRGNNGVAGIILLVSGMTDLMDGYLARRFNWISDLGKVLDPIADKLTQNAVCIILMIRLRAYWYFFAIIILKELVMLILGGYLLSRGVKLEGARWFGKISTGVFYVTMICIVLFPDMPDTVEFIALALSTVCALVAAGLYIPEFIRYRRMAKEGVRSGEGIIGRGAKKESAH